MFCKIAKINNFQKLDLLEINLQKMFICKNIDLLKINLQKYLFPKI